MRVADLIRQLQDIPAELIVVFTATLADRDIYFVPDFDALDTGPEDDKFFVSVNEIEVER